MSRMKLSWPILPWPVFPSSPPWDGGVWAWRANQPLGSCLCRVPTCSQTSSFCVPTRCRGSHLACLAGTARRLRAWGASGAQEEAHSTWPHTGSEQTGCLHAEGPSLASCGHKEAKGQHRVLGTGQPSGVGRPQLAFQCFWLDFPPRLSRSPARGT